jgi:antitoxin FitA
MATLYVRDVPDDLYERLREEARSSRRSIGATAIELLRAELPERRNSLTISEWLERARAMRERTRPSEGPTVVDDIRADRDR